MSTIYLIRHFKVKDAKKSWLNSEEFDAWVDAYDQYELEYIDVDLPQKIEKIYASSLQRTQKTATHLGGEFEPVELLVEVPPKAFMKTQIKLPKSLWLSISRLLWYFNRSSEENKKESIARADRFIDSVDLTQDILIVTHGFFMKVLIKRFVKCGFVGSIDISPKNGAIYRLTR